MSLLQIKLFTCYPKETLSIYHETPAEPSFHLAKS
jgi:hypothetical protein